MRTGQPEESRATLLGVGAILLWSLLATLTTLVSNIPPFELTALAFGTASLLAVLKWVIRREDPRAFLRQPPTTWLVGIFGLFGYHFLYFVALRSAPAAAANLINYLWPLLLVLLSGFVVREKLRWWHLLGALAGFSSTILLLRKGGSAMGFQRDYAAGYAAALGCALTWATYSVVSRRLRGVPTDAVGGFCAATAILSLIAHAALEPTVWPSAKEWLTVVLLGVGPIGGAFFLWDIGMKHGNLRALGAFSYAAPVLSTLLLVVCGRVQASSTLLFACLLVALGAVLAGRDARSPASRRTATKVVPPCTDL